MLQANSGLAATAVWRQCHKGNNTERSSGQRPWPGHRSISVFFHNCAIYRHIGCEKNARRLKCISLLKRFTTHVAMIGTLVFQFVCEADEIKSNQRREWMKNLGRSNRILEQSAPFLAVSQSATFTMQL
ncbi:hypothetical protein DdX_12471 [Ditylenchus destructor]|uniref:Uncharacterized protein n=1 Tax=Ditylenchus destructor TaxID=166010 RepID=A0AAD4N0L9_9BILA|nr:hypothetical protein DdX_12471 [Ditylenchus destructor]